MFTRPIASKSPYILFELETARKNGIPIVGIRPQGDQNISKVVREYAKIIIDWDTAQVVEQIRHPGQQPKAQVLASALAEVDDYANAGNGDDFEMDGDEVRPNRRSAKPF